MKRTIAILFLILAVAPSAFAGYCPVTTESDTSSGTSSLRGIIQNTVNKGSSSNCTMRYKDSSSGKYVETIDYNHFSQGIYFETPEMSGGVETITLSSGIEINTYSDIVIGNRNIDVLTDSANEVGDAKNGASAGYSDDFLVDAGIMSVSQGFTFYGYNEDYVTTAFSDSGANDWNDTTKVYYDYGYVVIDAREVDGKPFTCKDADADVYLRHMVILTSSYTKSQVFADDAETACLKDGGGVYVCKSSSWQEGKYPDTDDDWCKASFPGISKGDWTLTPGTGGINPGTGGDCEDEDKVTWYPDADGDTFGDASGDTIEDCDQPDGYADNGEDCDDASYTVHPNASEDCGDGIDNNCDELSDCSDGTCDSSNSCNAVGQESACADGSDNDGDGVADCDDADCATDSACYDDEDPSNPDLSDDTEETCDDDTDNDGDDAIDCEDSDCADDAACAETDTDADGYTLGEGDCDDSDADVHPDADEICADLIDNDCSGVIDETDSCIEASIDDIVEIDGSQLSGAGGCGCELRAGKAPLAQQAVLAILALLPIAMATVLREKAGRREISQP